MMRLIFAAAPMALLIACGSDPAPEPTEQIVVREPGQAGPADANAPAAATEPAAADGAELIATGQAAFAACMACHVVEAGAKSTIGPNLHGVVGRDAGAVDGFAYSDAMKASGLTWTEDELDSYLADPTGKVPGTTMVAGAIGDAERRAAIIAYLDSLDS